jgi:hypothetical protein
LRTSREKNKSVFLIFFLFAKTKPWSACPDILGKADLRPFGMGDTKTRNPAPPGLRVSCGIFLFGMVPPETPKFFTLFEFAPSVKDVMTGEV